MVPDTVSSYVEEQVDEWRVMRFVVWEKDDFRTQRMGTVVTVRGVVVGATFTRCEGQYGPCALG